jgi:esterase/lipase superfamily enzyme
MNPGARWNRRVRAGWIAALALTVSCAAGVPRESVAPPSAGGGGPAEADHTTVFFATNREPTGRTELRRFFGVEWGDATLGIARVRVPSARRFARLEKGPGRALRSPGTPIKQVVLEALVPASPDSFFASVAAAVEHSPSRRALVFVHGFNMPFERAVRYMAQLQRGLRTDEVAIVYSWPASRNYLADEEAARWTEADLASFLRSLAERVGAESIDLLGYSMGSRALVGAVGSLAGARRGAAADSPEADGSRSVPPRFGQLLLAAPDVEGRIFARTLPAIATAVRRVTLYASSRDRALRASHRVHGHARAGEAGRYLVPLPGIDTIDVSDVRSDLTGHGYLEELEGDIALVLARGEPPDRRPGLTPVTRDGRNWWRMSRR